MEYPAPVPPENTDTPNPEPASRAQTARKVFLAYLSAMLFAFTGGSMALPLLQRQLCDKYKLISKDKLMELYALGQTLPGVMSLNSGLLIGRSIAGWPGGLAAAAGCVLPAFFGMLLLTFSYTLLQGVPGVGGFVGGIRAASVAIILQTGLVIAGRARQVFFLLLAGAAFAAVFFLHGNVVLVVLLCGLAGVLREAARPREAGA